MASEGIIKTPVSIGNGKIGMVRSQKHLFPKREALNTTDSSKSGTKRSILTNDKGLFPDVAIGSANGHDMKMNKARP